MVYTVWHRTRYKCEVALSKPKLLEALSAPAYNTSKHSVKTAIKNNSN